MHPRTPRPTPACSWHRLPRFPTYGCYPCAFSDHLKKPRPCSDALSWSPRSSLEFRTSADGRAATGLQEGGGGRQGHGDQQHIPSLEPQCGVPVHILKHYNCLLYTGFVLSSSPFPPTHPHTPCSSHLLFSQLFYLYFYRSLSCGSYITWLEVFFWSMQQQADESGWADFPLIPSCLLALQSWPADCIMQQADEWGQASDSPFWTSLARLVL